MSSDKKISEVEALAKIQKVLNQLEPDQRKRVLEFLINSK